VELQHIAHRLSGAVYGTILATAVVVAVAGHPDQLPAQHSTTLLLVLVTSLVFWLAHVYAEAVGARLVAGHELGWPNILRIARGEWPMLQSSIPILIPLALASLGVVSEETGSWLAVLVGVGALFTYGWLIGRRENLGTGRSLMHALTTGSFGLVVLALKVFVH
jgi:hypothetical protein